MKYQNLGCRQVLCGEVLLVASGRSPPQAELVSKGLRWEDIGVSQGAGRTWPQALEGVGRRISDAHVCLLPAALVSSSLGSTRVHSLGGGGASRRLAQALWLWTTLPVVHRELIFLINPVIIL